MTQSPPRSSARAAWRQQKNNTFNERPPAIPHVLSYGHARVRHRTGDLMVSPPRAQAPVQCLKMGKETKHEFGGSVCLMWQEKCVRACVWGVGETRAVKGGACTLCESRCSLNYHTAEDRGEPPAHNDRVPLLMATRAAQAHALTHTLNKIHVNFFFLSQKKKRKEQKRKAGVQLLRNVSSALFTRSLFPHAHKHQHVECALRKRRRRKSEKQ